MVIHHLNLKEQWLCILQQLLTCNGFSCWSGAEGFPAPLHHVKKNLALSCEDPCSSEFMCDITMCSEGSASQHDELSLLCVPSVNAPGVLTEVADWCRCFVYSWALTLTYFCHFQQLWVSILTIIFCNKYFLSPRLRVALISRYIHKYLGVVLNTWLAKIKQARILNRTPLKFKSEMEDASQLFYVRVASRHNAA